jgi:hypothetical protein
MQFILDVVKTELTDDIKIKKEPLDSDEQQHVYEFPNGGQILDDNKSSMSQFMELFTANLNDLMIFQFPDALPGKATENEDDQEVNQIKKISL